MATEASLPVTPILLDTSALSSPPSPALRLSPNARNAETVPVTIYDFPSYEPKRLESFSAKHLDLPLRRDILHLAVVYEGDNTRQGTAVAKNRWEVHGSHGKVHPQKGMGRARVGSAQSPIRSGGGKAHGPRPERSYKTKLNRKVYDLAWRTALSYRYRRGELVVCQDGRMELPMPKDWDWVREQVTQSQHDRRTVAELLDGFRQKWVTQVLQWNAWDRTHGRSTFITTEHTANLFNCLELVPNNGRALKMSDVDVKDLLETGRLVVERSALLEMLKSHSSDLVTKVFVRGTCKGKRPESGKVLVQ